MSIKVMQEVWEHAPVSSGEMMVLLALADNADDERRECYPGIPYLARKARLGERQVRNCIRSLEDKGIITHRRAASHVGTNVYRIEPRSAWTGNICPPSDEVDRKPTSGGPAIHFRSDRQSTSAKPSEDPSEEPSENIPSLFPSEDPTDGKGRQASEKGNERKKEDPAVAFDEFWKAYPACKRKTDRPKAEALFRAIVTGKHKTIAATPAAEIIGGVKAWAASLKPADMDYVPLPTSWLNGARWEQWRADPVEEQDATPIVRLLVERMVRQQAEIERGDRKVIDIPVRDGLRRAQTIAHEAGWDAERWRAVVHSVRTEIMEVA